MSDYPVPPRCEQCGCRSAILLRESLHCLITDCTLPELLDRLSDLVDGQGTLSQNRPIQADWDSLCGLLEKATQQALVIAELKHRQGEEAWD